MDLIRTWAPCIISWTRPPALSAIPESWPQLLYRPPRTTLFCEGENLSCAAWPSLIDSSTGKSTPSSSCTSPCAIASASARGDVWLLSHVQDTTALPCHLLLGGVRERLGHQGSCRCAAVIQNCRKAGAGKVAAFTSTRAIILATVAMLHVRLYAWAHMGTPAHEYVRPTFFNVACNARTDETAMLQAREGI